VSKKDYNLIAAFEKAIVEKYGKNTVQDFRSYWEEEKEKDYLKQLKDRKTKTENKTNKEEIKAGEIIIRKRHKKEKQSRTCPVCKTYSFSMRDDLYMVRHECCYRCYVDFVEPDEKSWEEGNRPTEDYIQKILRGRK
jgi:hypothetical protein